MRDILSYNGRYILLSLLTEKRPVFGYTVFPLRDWNANIIFRLINIASVERIRACQGFN